MSKETDDMELNREDIVIAENADVALWKRVIDATTETLKGMKNDIKINEAVLDKANQMLIYAEENL